MELVWTHGESSVRDVVDRLARPLAYTTVMTTLDRLYKKGLLDRRKSERAFVYSSRLTRGEWEQKLVTGLLTDCQGSNELLISYLVDAVTERDASVLDDLEKKIRRKRRDLERQNAERRNAERQDGERPKK